MIKLFIIGLLLIFVVARFFDYIMYIARLLAGKEDEPRSTFERRKKKSKRDRDVQVYQNQEKRRKPFTGGEYIDYEEVKEDNSEEK